PARQGGAQHGQRSGAGQALTDCCHAEPLVTDLAGRTFLVTGATAGIGYATAQELASRGGLVYVGSRSQAKGDAAVAAIRTATDNGLVLPLSLDLADLASVRRAAQTVIDSGEPLHVLINNAGVGGVRGL